MGKRKSFQGREAFHRMNFLYQACHLLQAIPNEASFNLSAYYGHIMTGVAKKAVLKIDPSIKRTICKGCHILLIPGQTVTVIVKNRKSKQIQHMCMKCRTVKRFHLKTGHTIWSDKVESVVETINCKDESSSDCDEKCVGTTDNEAVPAATTLPITPSILKEPPPQ